MPAGSSFEADLRAVREARGLSLDEIQQQTRIPVDVLKRFEEGGLVGDPTYNDVYLKAFLRSYAKAVGVPAADVLEARRQQEAGAYGGALHPNGSAAPPRSGRGAEAGEGGAVRRAAPPPERQEAAGRTGAPAPAVEALASAPDPTVRREPEPERPAPSSRVSRAEVSTKRSFDKNWGVILGLFAVVVAVLAAALYFLVFAGDDEPEADVPDTVAIGDGAEAVIDTSGVGAGAATGGPQLQLPIEVTVEATGGNGLQSFRVTEDAAERQPHWINLGDSQAFSADSALVLWGQDTFVPGEATYVFQGQRFTPASEAPLRITRETGQRVLDSLAAR
ncbi:helix-turn-helix domain-containing protein [Rubrivirga sp. S365]|uniref:Helix-turn-helix domain-containing protein n=1 Tax=Rubrivirga litoralis TaxID=3075598 RepID=A0ABU3BUP0_9BACT|nr:MULTISPECIES: helix-turn-helix domain-containing protein [unclassified Rubrivirga]MDT0633011.1 helix-turn-helix domain-containing protein [Rubrivirga sp. F394]MDT7856926.1 helix-turn-helix domain-containing protein [Rubrivirga sp. S365]